MMRHLVSAMLVIVGVIHLLPLSGVLGGARLEALYGIPVALWSQRGAAAP
jgi:hypothetical protein